MKSFYKVLDKIKDIVSAEPFNHSMTFGDIGDVDLKKQTLFPLAHVMVNNASIESQYVNFNCTIFFMDIVDITNQQTTDQYRGNDNTFDILNTQLALATRVMRVIEKGELYRDDFELSASANCEPFTERFDNTLCGWSVTFDVSLQDNMTYC